MPFERERVLIELQHKDFNLQLAFKDLLEVVEASLLQDLVVADKEWVLT